MKCLYRFRIFSERCACGEDVQAGVGVSASLLVLGAPVVKTFRLVLGCLPRSWSWGRLRCRRSGWCWGVCLTPGLGGACGEDVQAGVGVSALLLVLGALLVSCRRERCSL